MRSGVAAGVLFAFLVGGCLGSESHWAEWSDPTVATWLFENATAAGFERQEHDAALNTDDPEILGALPRGATLSSMSYMGSEEPGLTIQSTGLHVWCKADVPIETILEGIDKALDEAYDGPQSERDAAVATFQREWEEAVAEYDDPSFYLLGNLVALDGPWNISGLAPRPVMFLPQGNPEQPILGWATATADNATWSLRAQLAEWKLDRSDITIRIDSFGRARSYGDALTEEAFQRDVAQAFPGHTPVFDDLRFSQTHGD